MKCYPLTVPAWVFSFQLEFGKSSLIDFLKFLGGTIGALAVIYGLLFGIIGLLHLLAWITGGG